MDIKTACRILGVEKNASLREIESAKRKLLQALHPDKHPPEQREIFGRLTREVVEAAKFLKVDVKRTVELETRGESHIAEDPFARDGRLVQTIVNQLDYSLTFAPTPTPNLVLMLKTIGESCCETDRARKLFAGMLTSYSGDYGKVKNYLLKGWQNSGNE